MFTISSFLLMKKLQPEFCKTAGSTMLLITMKTLYLSKTFVFFIDDCTIPLT